MGHDFRVRGTITKRARPNGAGTERTVKRNSCVVGILRTGASDVRGGKQDWPTWPPAMESRPRYNGPWCRGQCLLTLLLPWLLTSALTRTTGYLYGSMNPRTVRRTEGRGRSEYSPMHKRNRLGVCAPGTGALRGTSPFTSPPPFTRNLFPVRVVRVVLPVCSIVLKNKPKKKPYRGVIKIKIIIIKSYPAPPLTIIFPKIVFTPICIASAVVPNRVVRV